MAHYDLTSGNVMLSEHDVAEKIYERLAEKEFVEVISDTTETGVSLDVSMRQLPDTPGLYLIYHKGDFNQYECMYAGEGNIRYRVYRFEKELADKSREDENHPAARKVRRTGFIRHGDPIYVKYITKTERDSVVVDTLCKYLRLQKIDEHIAHIAGAKFNKRIKKA